MTFGAYVLVFGTLFTLFFLGRGEEICYGNYGCFSNEYPFDRALIPKPKSPNEIATSFHLCRDNCDSKVLINDHDVALLEASGYDGAKKTVILIHGFSENLEYDWLVLMSKSMKAKEQNAVNVIMVDWSGGAGGLYTQAVANTRIVGAQVAVLIKFLNQQTGNSPDSFHVVGFSLGAHVAGYAGKRLNGNLARISGLDPAGPSYAKTHTDVRLDPTDAVFVDAIHTDTDGFGIPHSCGDVDFYPNSGNKQRKCAGFDFTEVVDSLACDHVTAHDYYVDSIRYPCQFRAFPCSSWEEFTRGNCMTCGSTGCNEMGYNANANSKGNYYLYTNAESPYCVFKYAYATFETNTGFLKFGGSDPGIRLQGQIATSDDIRLGRTRTMSKGSTERFVAPIQKDLGPLTSIYIWHYNLLGVWSLKKVVIEMLDTTHQKYSSCDKASIKRTAINKALKVGDVSC